MSQKNIEVVRQVYGAWTRDGIPGSIELLDPEIEYVNPAGAIEPGIRCGLPAFIAAVERCSRDGRPGRPNRSSSERWETRSRLWCGIEHAPDGAASRWRAASRRCGL